VNSAPTGFLTAPLISRTICRAPLCLDAAAAASGGIVPGARQRHRDASSIPQVIELDAEDVHHAHSSKKRQQALLDLLREGEPEEFEPVAIACTAVEAADAVQIAEMRNDKKARLLGSNSFNVRPNGADTPPRGRGFSTMQSTLATKHGFVAHVPVRAAGVKHIGYGPLKSENQDEYLIQVGCQELLAARSCCQEPLLRGASSAAATPPGRGRGTQQSRQDLSRCVMLCRRSGAWVASQAATSSASSTATATTAKWPPRPPASSWRRSWTESCAPSTR
jgi:hypothetical protein